MSTYDLTAFFCKIDDFCNKFEPNWLTILLEQKVRSRKRQSNLTLSEIMTIVIAFHYSKMRTFKGFYLFLLTYHKREFPGLVSYARFLTLMKPCLVPLFAFIESEKGACTGVSIIDATPIVVCHNKRISSHRVFKGLAKRGKSSTGWFFGFKLHIIVNHLGELLSFKMTPGNIGDRSPVAALTKGVVGKLFADKGYISSQLFENLLEKGLQLITKLKANMKNKLMSVVDRMLLQKRSLIETIYGQLKEVFQIEHTRHRCPHNCLINMLSGLAAYCLYDKKPQIHLSEQVALQIITA